MKIIKKKLSLNNNEVKFSISSCNVFFPESNGLKSNASVLVFVFFTLFLYQMKIGCETLSTEDRFLSYLVGG